MWDQSVLEPSTPTRFVTSFPSVFSIALISMFVTQLACVDIYLSPRSPECSEPGGPDASCGHKSFLPGNRAKRSRGYAGSNYYMVSLAVMPAPAIHCAQNNDPPFSNPQDVPRFDCNLLHGHVTVKPGVRPSKRKRGTFRRSFGLLEAPAGVVDVRMGVVGPCYPLFAGQLLFCGHGPQPRTTWTDRTCQYHINLIPTRSATTFPPPLQTG